MYAKRTEAPYQPLLPPAHEEVEDEEDEDCEADEVVHVFRAARCEHCAQFRNRIRKQIRGCSETFALEEGMSRSNCRLRRDSLPCRREAGSDSSLPD